MATSTIEVARHTLPPVGEADSVLAARVRAGDRDAFAELYRSTVDRLTEFVARRVTQHDAHLADDLVQEAYCLALAEPHHIAPDLIGSMYRFAARTVRHHRRSQRRSLRAAAMPADRTGAPVTGTATARRPIAAIALTGTEPAAFDQLLAGLPAEQRRAVQLRYLDGHTRREVAARMHRTVTAVHQLESCALRRLHELLTATPGAA